MMKPLVLCHVVVALAAVSAQAIPSIGAIASDAERAAAAFSTPFQSVEQADTFVEDNDVEVEPVFFPSADFDDNEFWLDDEGVDDEKTDAEAWVEAAKIPPRKQPKVTCSTKCGDKCFKVKQFKSPLLSNLCRKSCGRKCSAGRMDQLFKCTLDCARAMPPTFRSDEKKAGSYVNNCYKKCMKKNDD